MGIRKRMSRRNRLKLENRDGVTVLNLGNIEIWDGADLSLIRDTMIELINDDGHRKIGVDLTYVKYIPSGFFGMLVDWLDKGVGIWVYTPQAHVMEMLWFRQFFVADGAAGCYVLLPEPKSVPRPQPNPAWAASLSDSVDDVVDSIEELQPAQELKSVTVGSTE